jgi:uncharacterized membrane protein (DUF485 family)
MSGFDHGAPSAAEDAARLAPTRHSRPGLILFAVYLLCYSTFVLMNAFAPGIMARTPWAGINVAVLSGLALIVTAFALALFYDWICRFAIAPREERESSR